MIAASNRVVGVVPLPTEEGLGDLRYQARLLARQIGMVPEWSEEQFVYSYVGRRLNRYLQAWETFAEKPLWKGDARVEAFVKAEKFNPLAKRNPDPRMIQLRHPRYNIKLGVYLRPIEHRLYKLKGPTGLRIIAKGLAPNERAKLLVQKMRKFDKPVVISVDGSRWDKHISPEILKVEHQVYMACNNDPQLRMLLSWQLTNRVRTRNGVKYTVRGNRMSGDMNTAVGNCLLMVLMVRAYARKIGLKKWDFFDDGDDCLLLFEESQEELVQESLQRVFLSYGQETKIENRATTPEQVVFCQSRPVWDGTAWTMTRDWQKCLSQDCSGARKWGTPNLVRGMMGAVGICNLSMCRGIPILQEWALACIRNSRGAGIPKSFLDDEEAYLRIKHTTGWTWAETCRRQEAQPITVAARFSFHDAWGVDPEQQQHIEEQLREWELSDVFAEERAPEYSSDWALDLHPEDPIALHI